MSRVGAMHLRARVEKSCYPALDDRGTCGQGREKGEQQTYGSVEAGELLVVREGQVEMHALEVCPAVTATVENTVERLVNGAVVVRPQLHLPHRVHPRVHRRRHQPAAEQSEALVDLSHIRLKRLGQAVEEWCRLGRLQLDDVEGQLV